MHEQALARLPSPAFRRRNCLAERSRTPATEGGPIDAYALAQGRNMSLPGVKTEVRLPPACGLLHSEAGRLGRQHPAQRPALQRLLSLMAHPALP